MNALFISADAIHELMSFRQLQSAEFSSSAILIDFLKGKSDNWIFSNINFVTNDNTKFIYTSKPNTKNGIVFDLNSFRGFETKRDDQTIILFQKILRFAVKIIEDLPSLASCEKHLDGSFSVIFPFPDDGYRIIVERKPLGNRLEKRSARYIFVIADALQEIQLRPNHTLFKKVIDKASEICIIKHYNETQENTAINSLVVDELDGNPLTLDAGLGFEHWSQYLTNTQSNFINRPVKGAERLEGAAGTGKTLTMILKAIKLIKDNCEVNNRFDIIFIVHSISTKKHIEDVFISNFPEITSHFDRNYKNSSILITTLQEWCIDYLGGSINLSEYVDRDAEDSKTYQILCIEAALEEMYLNDFSTFEKICSKKIISFFKETPKGELLEMLQHEIAVIIKGRAREDFDKYKQLNRPKFSIPCELENDLALLHNIYLYYQKRLQLTGQFDSDDIIISSLAQLSTPIWKRRRIKEGFDVCFVDETHLFNLNELSIFHYFSKLEKEGSIIFSIDKSQAVGDRGLIDNELYEALGFVENEDKNVYKTIFRSSTDIVNLAFSVLSSGATLFTNFENPLINTADSFTNEDQKKSIKPKYKTSYDYEDMIKETFNVADKLCEKMQSQKSKVLIIATSSSILIDLEKFAKENHKPIEVIKKRGDVNTVKEAIKTNRFVVSGIDYVGGLEFDGVVIVGVDDSRVPPTHHSGTDSYHFLNYAWHNRMYVAITRAKYSIVLLGEKTRKTARLLEKAIKSNIIDLE